MKTRVESINPTPEQWGILHMFISSWATFHIINWEFGNTKRFGGLENQSGNGANVRFFVFMKSTIFIEIKGNTCKVKIRCFMSFNKNVIRDFNSGKRKKSPTQYNLKLTILTWAKSQHVVLEDCFHLNELCFGCMVDVVWATNVRIPLSSPHSNGDKKRKKKLLQINCYTLISTRQNLKTKLF